MLLLKLLKKIILCQKLKLIILNFHMFMKEAKVMKHMKLKKIMKMKLKKIDILFKKKLF